jgi:hypothetical protein
MTASVRIAAAGRVLGICVMKKAVAILLLGMFGLALAGCAGPCGFIWDDWRWSKSCHAGPDPAK